MQNVDITDHILKFELASGCITNQAKQSSGGDGFSANICGDVYDKKNLEYMVHVPIKVLTGGLLKFLVAC